MMILPYKTEILVTHLKKILPVKLDTGADHSSIDLDFALGLQIWGQTRISNSLGKSQRAPWTRIEIKLPDPIGLRIIRVNLADRAHLRYPLLLGRSALTGILVDPCT